MITPPIYQLLNNIERIIDNHGICDARKMVEIRSLFHKYKKDSPPPVIPMTLMQADLHIPGVGRVHD